MSTRTTLAARRELLVARSDLERLDFSIAARDLADSFGTHGAAARFRNTHPLLSRALRLTIPLIGASRLGVLVRGLSIGLVTFRIVRALRRTRRAPA